jgi:hypothetical protein
VSDVTAVILQYVMKRKENWYDVYSMLASALPKPERSNKSPCLIRRIHKMKGSHLFWLSRSKGMSIDILIRDYNPPRCFQ